MATEIELGWLAGILDGEGCICGCWSNRRNGIGGNVYVEVRVESCSVAMIVKVAMICADIGVHTAVENDRFQKGATRTSHRVLVSRREDVLKLLRTIRPYLVVKQAEANVAVEFYERFGDQRRSRQGRATLNEKVALFDTLRSLKKIA